MAKRRAAGEGTVRKRADGRWEGRIIVGHKENGKPLYKAVFAKTQKELLPKLHALVEEYRHVDLSEASSLTVEEWCGRWVEAYAVPTLRPSTVKGYVSLLNNHIYPALGNTKIRFLTTTAVQKLYNRLKQKNADTGQQTLADSGVRKVHMLLHEIMEAAVAAHLIPKNPTTGTSVPKCNYPPKKILNDEQLERFMDAIQRDPVWHAFFYTEMTTGLRRGEICAAIDKEAIL